MGAIITMETREELLEKLGEALNIIQNMSSINQKLNNVRSQYKGKLPKAKFSRIGIVIIILLLITWMVLEAIVVFVILKIRQMNKDKNNEKLNQERIEINKKLHIQEEQLIQKLRDTTQYYRQTVGTWYPEEYCSLEAVEFFYTAVKSRRADSLKEAINLYENTMHQRRVEQNQNQALQQQRYANMMAMSNMIIQTAQLSNINDNLSRLNEKVPYVHYRKY